MHGRYRASGTVFYKLTVDRVLSPCSETYRRRVVGVLEAPQKLCLVEGLQMVDVQAGGECRKLMFLQPQLPESWQKK